ncbi:MAG TPA: tetratricopeptide repeat protein [Ferruginibacter sp.]|nr:tetratricopeptide repeat protein [Ferruginibacter sp.]
MKKLFLLAAVVMIHVSVTAQDAAELHKTARNYMQQGDHANAILVLNRAVALQPGNVEISKDLALNYYYAKEYSKALDVLKPMIEKETADDHCYQIAGDAYMALDQAKDAEKIYRKGIKKVSNSGALYNELGKLLWSQGDYSAIKQWEKGIESDPGFPGNYYNAAKYYYFSTEKVWGLIYGEVFLNMDPQSMYAAEMKNILLEGYKKLFAETNLEKNNPEKNNFVAAFLSTMNKQSSAASGGINAESLTMIRTRFILDWYPANAAKFPYKLFDLQKQLLQDGLFEAYNQWIFAAAQNLPAYQNWVTAHTKEYNELSRFQKNRVFKISSGQYYH